MVTTVKLQPAFEYYWWVLFLAALLLMGAIALLSYTVYRCFELGIFTRKKTVIHRPPLKTLLQIKEDYANRLQSLAYSYSGNMVSKREAYQSLSFLIRGFVHETTGINVENYTKSEIKELGLPNLDRLMEEYYVPEFAEDEKSVDRDFLTSCNTALGVIQIWR